jgi:hypothetical protein
MHLFRGLGDAHRKLYAAFSDNHDAVAAWMSRAYLTLEASFLSTSRVKRGCHPFLHDGSASEPSRVVTHRHCSGSHSLNKNKDLVDLVVRVSWCRGALRDLSQPLLKLTPVQVKGSLQPFRIERTFESCIDRANDCQGTALIGCLRLKPSKWGIREEIGFVSKNVPPGSKSAELLPSISTDCSTS